MASICVFCGSREGSHPEYSETARKLGVFLASQGHTLIYGGGSTGIMGVLANSVLSAGGHVIGVITTHLARPELMHDSVTSMHVMNDMHQRKAKMHALADAYIALPGGYGTLEEVFEAVTWAQLELHARPMAVLNAQGLYDGLFQLLDTMVSEEFMSPACRSLLTETSTIEALTEWIESQFPENLNAASVIQGRRPLRAGRFVVLRHDHPFLHWDFLLEHGDTAATWRLLAEPVAGVPIPCERIADHRLHYLNYEGPVSGGRGAVMRVAAGFYQTEQIVSASSLNSGTDNDGWSVRFSKTDFAERAVLSGNEQGQLCWLFQ